ncbi:zf-TFIIB domain-containing protein [Saliphagus sp. GCM10025308]|uniref:Zf-TFIIB domain-containing protein n=1 Tax=Natronosalvus rutilus TaxID=2953753 RepID=A0A9E7N7V9_9EURY|nr:zf-TFIIB domain-containing protein [Natronosalvus rutilus]UTF53327.1 zf-TFIIB domain-containing protein [Natronosalvus rutilus]
MPTCPYCKRTVETSALVRHETGDLLIVHCPDCHGALGTYREPGRF